MAEIWVTREDFEGGELPEVCVVTGEPADGLVGYRFESYPEWMWLLLFAGFFPFFIAMYFLKDDVEGLVPIRRDVIRRFHRRRRRALAVAAAGAILTVSGWVFPTGSTVRLSDALLVSGLALLVVGGVAAGLTFRRFVDANLDKTGLWVKLKRVHPNFVQHAAAWNRTPQGRRPVLR